MKIRFKIQSPANTGAPDYDINGQALADLAFLNTTLNLTLGETSILSTTDLNAVAFPLSGTTDNGDAYTLSIEDSTFILLEILCSHSILNSNDLTVECKKTGYLDFYNTFKFYNYDVGNNASRTYSNGNNITENPDFKVIMIAEVDNVDGLGYQRKPYTSFIAIHKPFTSLVTLYKTNSSTGTASYYNADNDELLGSGNSIVISLDDTIEVYQTDTLITGEEESSGTNLVVEKKTYFPEWSAELTSLPQDYPDAINIDSLRTLIANIDFSSMSPFYVGDAIAYPARNFRVNLDVIDYTGAVLSSVYKTIVTDLLPYIYDQADTTFTDIVIPSNGDYIMSVKLEAVGLDSDGLNTDGSLIEGTCYRIEESSNGTDFTTLGAENNSKFTEFFYNGSTIAWFVGDAVEPINTIMECTKNISVVADNFWRVTEDSCGSYIVSNNSFEEVALNIYSLNSNKEFVLSSDSPVIIDAMSEYNLVIGTDNVYKLVITRDSIDYIYILVSYCGLSTCYLTKIQEVICADTCDLSLTTMYDFAAFTLAVNMYFSLLNNEYSFNYMYTSLDSDKLDELYDIKTILENALRYCDTSDCGGNGGNCGCQKCNS